MLSLTDDTRFFQKSEKTGEKTREKDLESVEFVENTKACPRALRLLALDFDNPWGIWYNNNTEGKEAVKS